MIRLSASTNPPKEKDLVKYVQAVQAAGVDFLHCDVMDTNFVPNSCLSFELLSEVKQHTLLPLDIHLMVNEPYKVVKKYATLGAMFITVHYEAFEWRDVFEKTVRAIRKAGAMVGLSIKPTTLVKEIIPLLPLVDLVLVMGVEPGKSGQKTLSNTAPKIEELRAIIRQNNYDILIEVDGGINKDNIKQMYNSGADIVVMGNALYLADDRRKLVDYVHKIH